MFKSRKGRLFCKSKADPPHGFNVLGVGSCLQLLADVGDVNVDRLVFSDIVIIPGIIVNLLLGVDFGGMGEQQFQNLEFLLCQRIS